MFCPNCSSFLTEKDLIKSKMKTWENTEIEYQATCPFCEEMIGRMFWGQLVVRPELLDKYEALQKRMFQEQVGRAVAKATHAREDADPAALQAEEEPYLIGLEGEAFDWSEGEESPGESDSYYGAGQLSGHYCPHCGKDLPNDIDLLPRRFSY